MTRLNKSFLTNFYINLASVFIQFTKLYFTTNNIKYKKPSWNDQQNIPKL